MTAGLGRTLTYTSYNMPSQVVGVGYSGGASTTYNYVYNAEHERTKLVHSTLGTFIYLHPAGKGQLLYEKQTEASPSTRIEHKYYISAGGTSVAVHYARENPNLTETTIATRYLHQDHLGSITLITNEAGGVTERLAYEAYGKRRYPAGTDDPTNGLFGQVTDRGFTSHEHLDEIALIHMNGRVYDPVLGRFVTADPYLQNQSNLQSYNRYSYVLNNPLMYTDPSGYFSLKKVFRAAVAVAAIAFAPQISAWAVSTLGPAGLGLSATIANGIVGGAIVGYVATGTFQGAVSGGLSGALFAGIGNLELSGFSKVLAHAAGGCAMGVASGGKCGQGALASGAGASLGSLFSNLGAIGEGIARAVVGGTFSVMGGGKFANGAITAAYAYTFNDMQHEMSADGTFRSDGDTAYPQTREEWLQHAKDFSMGATVTVAASVGGPIAIGAGLDLVMPGTVVIGSMADQALILETASAIGGRTFVGKFGGAFYGAGRSIGEFANKAWVRFTIWRGDQVLSVTPRAEATGKMLSTEIRMYEQAGRSVQFLPKP